MALGSLREKAFYLDSVESVKKGWKLLKPPIFNGAFFGFPTKEDDGTSKVTEEKEVTHMLMLSGTSDTQPLDVWHKRLGHLNEQAIVQLSSISTGLNIGPAKSPTISMRCDPCLKASQTQTISKMVREEQEFILGCVHLDLKGPCIEKGLYGYAYFMACTDEKSRYTKTYPLLTKGDAFGAFRAYLAESERETGLRLRDIQCDGGTEFINAEFRTFCVNKGIKIRLTAPYTPEMNGIAERVNRTLVEHASAML